MAEGRIKSVLICGFLGAGKTTFLAGLLKSPQFKDKRIAVIVNEFGSLHVDGAILPKGDYHLAEINKGSIFCVCVKTDLMRALDAIARDIKPEWLLIEATGLAEPSDFGALLQTEFLRKSYSKASIVCVADAVNFPKLSQILPTLSVQVRVADIILLNKCDLAQEPQILEVEEKLRKLTPSAKIVRTSNAVLPLESAEDLVFERGLDEEDANSEPHLCKAPPEHTESMELRSLRPLPKARFYEFLDSCRNNIIRAKGIADFGDSRRYVEVVNGAVTAKSAEGIDLGSEGTAICIILRNMKAIDFREEFNKIFKEA